MSEAKVTASQKTSRLSSNIALGIMTLASIAIGFYALAFQARLAGSPEFHARFDEIAITSSMHVIGGGVILLLGAFQFWPHLRRSYPAWHRSMGKVYLCFVAIGGIGGLLMAPVSDGGLVAHFGFGLLALLWMFSGAMAYRCIRQGNIKAHQEWMMRNYAMAFGAVTLRIYLGIFAASGVPFSEGYPVVAWLAWVPNLILVEWYLAIKQYK